MEAYYVDYNNYPPEYLFSGNPGTEVERVMKAEKHLTTPIDYISSIPHDVFTNETWDPPLYWYYNWHERYDTFINLNSPGWYNGTCPWYNEPAAWVLTSLGPDYTADFPMIYDPTNGTISNGDISRLGPGGGGR
jgi:hypothetical protein